MALQSLESNPQLSFATRMEDWTCLGKMVEITSDEQNKIKRMKRAEDSLRDHIKSTNIQTTGVPEEEEKKKGYEKIFEEIIVENFPTLKRE